MAVHISKDKIDYVTVCPDCAIAHMDEALAEQRRQAAENDEYQEWLSQHTATESRAERNVNYFLAVMNRQEMTNE